ncbi:MAG TPA: tetratricopeptide repeat protein [Cyclobacteriaceae bacterium]|nr:tetratricopeptide repeat protein [Cyclobacteriaceae bacterium]HRJ82267.1 tetratricopeptide repeat protein [Cyclobacteriaceae bacterium]
MAQTSGNKNTSTRWLLMAGFFLVMWALFWSVDALVMYISLGGAAFCVAQYLVKTWDQKGSVQRKYPQQERQADTARESLVDLFKKLLQTNPGDAPQKKLFIALMVGSVMSFFVLAIILNVVFGTTDEDSVAYLQRARDFYYTSQYDSASYYYQLANEEDPDNPDIYVEYGNIFLITDRYEDALTQYEKALAIDPRHSDAQYNKGLVYYEQKRYSEAIKVTTNILYYDPSYYHAMLLIGDCYYTQNQLDSALRFYEGAYVNNYKSSQLTYMLAYLYDTKGETGRAIELYKETLSLDSANSDSYERLSELLPPEEGNWYRTRAAQIKQGTNW